MNKHKRQHKIREHVSFSCAFAWSYFTFLNKAYGYQYISNRLSIERTIANPLLINILYGVYISSVQAFKRGQITHRTCVLTVFYSAVTSTFNIICEWPSSGAYSSIFSFLFYVVCAQHTKHKAIDIIMFVLIVISHEFDSGARPEVGFTYPS